MRIAYITAGAAGMFCGSCLRDNALVAALGKIGHDALLIPTYTPIRTDEADVSQDRIFFGGINVYLEQKFWLFRHTPRFLDRLFNARWLLRLVSPLAARTRYSTLGGLTISMLKGTRGKQRKEVAKLTDWLAADVKPEAVVLTNALISGIVPRIQQALGVPVFVTLQGDDAFLDALSDAERRHCIELIRQNCAGIAAFICTSRYYADYMADYLGVPRERMQVILPGINLAGHGGPRPVRTEHPLTIGYFARICPEKGFHALVDAYLRLRAVPGSPPVRLRAGGYLGANHRPYFEAQIARLAAAGLASDFEHHTAPTHADKVQFLQSIDILSVPATFHEPKGLYILEALANGVPVVQPHHGSFPELIEATGGGLLVSPDDPAALAAGLRQMLDDPGLRDRCGRAGAAAVGERFTAAAMARDATTLLERHVRTPTLTT